MAGVEHAMKEIKTPEKKDIAIIIMVTPIFLRWYILETNINIVT